MIRTYGIFEMMSLYGVFVSFFGYMTTGAYWSLQTTCKYGDFVRFFRLNDNSGFSRCFFFLIIFSQIFIKTLQKLRSHKEVLMKYFTVLNNIIRWQNNSTSRMFCNMVISIVFLLLFPLWQKGQKKCSSGVPIGAFWLAKSDHFMEGMLHLELIQIFWGKILKFFERQKNAILQGKR